ncbi:aromatic acid exporter family protein [Streptomyces sp. WAC 06738]|uniref:aromatic acid exporter family protein n=1 Tax=Streptomyces sp. WAC 06738 TaxID=2203210 RepID=UPI001F0BC6C0|nr:aromatic acid exporter family protein [Streptomyces sp. WAC 06738]
MHAAVRRPGYERDDVLLLGKSVAAVVAAWTLASWLLPPQVTTFAPFTTLLALQATVYRSVWHSVRYVAAVGVGVVLATGFGAVAGVHAWSLALMMLVAFAAGRLELIGALRLQVPVTALFAAGGGQVDYGLALASAVGTGL